MTYTRYDDRLRMGPAGDAGQSENFRQQFSSFRRMLGNVLELWSNRRAIYKLSLLEDRSLKDIGISRGDIDWALSHPWHVDPSLKLRDRVERRKGAQRWARTFRSS